MFYDEPFIVDLPVTRCAIEAQLTDLEGSLFVSSIRIGGGELATASLLGSFDVPFGQLGICDREAMEAAFSALPEERMVEYFDQLSFTELRGAASVANETMWIVRPGFGASTCNAYDLRGADGSRGVLIDCVAAIDFT
jgi:hypothetical protein